MSRKRDRLEIIRDILSVIKDKGSEVKPTHILYRSNLSHKMLNEYLSELMEKGFVVENKDKKGKVSYSLTKKGSDYVYDFKVIRSFMESYGLE